MKKDSLIIVFSFYMFYVIINWNSALGMEVTPEWHTSASCKIVLSVKDKWNIDKPFRATYVVKLSPDVVFMAERDGGVMSQPSTKVVFPDDFYIPETNHKAWIAFNGKESIWEIYVNNELIETGTFSFKRSMIND